MDWKELELAIYEYFDKVWQNIKVEHNITIRGKISGKLRQIDVFISGIYEGKDQKVVIDAKQYNKKIDIKTVESMLSMLDDVGANKGIIVTSIGFTKGAIERAHNDSRDFELDILRTDDIQDGNSLFVTIRKSKYGAMLVAPFGWNYNATICGKLGFLTFAYAKGVDLELSMSKGETLGIDILSKRAYPFSINKYFEDREHLYLLIPNYLGRRKIKIRKVRTNHKLVIYENQYSQTNRREFIGVLELDTFYLIAYLNCNSEFRNRDIEKMLFVFENAILLNVQQRSILEGLLKDVEDKKATENDEIHKSELCYLQSLMCKDFEEYEMMEKYISEGLKIFPNNYALLKLKLVNGLESKVSKIKLKVMLMDILSLGYHNPTCFSDTRLIFQDYQKIQSYRELMKNILSIKIKILDAKSKGNFYFAIATTYMIEEKVQIEKYMNLARLEFSNSEPIENDGIEMIDRLLLQLEVDYKKYQRYISKIKIK